MPKLRVWDGSTPVIATGKLIRETENGMIIEDVKGRRFYAGNHNVISRVDEPRVKADLFASLD